MIFPHHYIILSDYFIPHCITGTPLTAFKCQKIKKSTIPPPLCDAFSENLWFEFVSYVSCYLNIFFSAGLLLWRAVQLSPTSPSSGSRPSGTRLWGLSRPSTIHTPTSTHTWTTSALSTAAPPSPFCQPPGASALQMVSKMKHKLIHAHTTHDACTLTHSAAHSPSRGW